MKIYFLSFRKDSNKTVIIKQNMIVFAVKLKPTWPRVLCSTQCQKTISNIYIFLRANIMP